MATEEQKRKADGLAHNGEEAAAKRQRLENGSTAPAAAGAAGAPAAGSALPKRLGIDLEKLQKAKAALQKQKELAEKLKKAGITLGQGRPPGPTAAAPRPAAPGAIPPRPALVGGPASAERAAAAAAVAAAMLAPGAAPPSLPPADLTSAALGVSLPKPATKLPPPLLLDDEGREIDPATGKPIERAPEPAPLPTAAQQQEQQAEEDAERFFDPTIGNRGLRRLQRRPRASFQFVEEGKLQKQAEISRLRAKYGDAATKQLAERRKAEAALAATGGDVNLVPLGQRAAPAAEGEEQKAEEEPIPDVEWWDARILAERSYGGVVDGEPAQLREGRITHLVEHPVLIEPPAEAPPPPPQPLKLTKRELKKLRTQRRVAREKEKQELVRQGLLEPPKPKVKISNLMRVLGAEATADPTAIEAEVRKQMAERAAAHEDRNLARMLTPAERKDKKLKKLVGEEGPEVHVALYKIGDLTNAQLRFKVDVNARENHMTGCCLVQGEGTGFALVAVEGTPKTLRRYEKLMLRRIDWNQGREEEEEEEETKPAKPPNYCHLVWQGVVKQRTFKKFKSETVHSEAAAKTFLADHNLAHYWELCAAYHPE